MKNTDNRVKLRKVLEECLHIELAYIFGSTVKWRSKSPGDVDIAILLNNKLGVEERLEIILDVADKAEKIFGRRADIVVLNDKSSFLKYQVVKHGKMVFERKAGFDAAFRFRLMTEYFDNILLQRFFYWRMMERRGHG